MIQFCAKKLAVIGNASASITNCRKDLEEVSVNQKLDTVKCIPWNVELNKGNEEVLAIIDFESEANLIVQGYLAKSLLKTLNTS